MSSNKLAKFDFVTHRKKFFILSSVIIVFGLIMLSVLGLNTGVDFSAGTSLDVTIGPNSIDNEEARELILSAVDVEPVITIGGAANNRVSTRFPDVLSDAERQALLSVFYDKYGEEHVSHEENTVDPVIAQELVRKAIIAVAIASIGILIYVSIRFEWRIALASVIALLHDALIIISMFSIFRWEVNLPFIAAVLTIIGYSINATIVLFDRIRENMSFAKLKTIDDYAKLLNGSIQQTFMRVFNTTITCVFAVVILMVLGSEAIRLFSLAILIGLISGAYTTLFIAGQLWLTFRGKSMNKRKLEQPSA